MNPSHSLNDQVLNNTNTNACVTVEPSTPNKSLRNESETVSDPAQCAKTMATIPITVPLPEIEVEMSPRLRAISKMDAMEVNFDQGYDSDGDIGPFFYASMMEGEQMHDEMPLGEELIFSRLEAEENTTTEEIVTAEVICHHVDVDEETLLHMKREHLKDELRKRGEKLSGNKSELLDRLQKAVSNKVPVGSTNKSKQINNKNTNKKLV